MTEPTKGKGHLWWWIGGGVLVVGIIILVVLLLLKKKKAEQLPGDKGYDDEDKGGADKKVDYQPDPVDPFDPYNPVDPPEKGKAYAVKTGDSMFAVLSRAGFPKTRRYAAYLAMLKDPANEWMGFNTYTGSKSLEDRQRFAPMPGYETKPYAWNTQKFSRPSSSHRRPVWRVPADHEVPS